MKRSNSAPMIPEMLDTVELKPPTVNSLFSRRGLSSSNVSLPGDIVRPELSPRRQPLSLSRINSPTSRQHRVEQLKKEELIDERQNEREVQEQILLTKTCSDMKLNPEDHELMKPESMDFQISPTHQSFASPASPLARMRSRSLTPTSPSSARTFSYRRSCSPVLRPSSLCFGQKRKREQDTEDMMDISPSSIPNKKLHLGSSGGYGSPLNLSPCVSPLMSAPHSFHPAAIALINNAGSRKSSSTQSESTPLSSPSSLVQLSINPFAINYDSGNCEHWQSSHSGSASGSTCSSASQSPPGITVSEEQKMMMDSGSIEVSTEPPTPLSPKGLEFRQKPNSNLCSSLPSPIPSRTLSNGTVYAPIALGPHAHIVSANGLLGGINPHISAVGTGIPLRGGHNRAILKPYPLHHDKHLSPFISELPHQYSNRPIKVANRSRILGKADSSRSSSPASLTTSSSFSSSSSMEHHHSGTRLNSRLNSCSSPLAKLSMSSSLEESSSSLLAGAHGNTSAMLSASGSSGIPIHQLQVKERHLIKRRTSETSTDSQEENLMESDSEGQSIVSGLEDPVGVNLCSSEGQKPFDTKVLRTHS